MNQGWKFKCVNLTRKEMANLKPGDKVAADICGWQDCEVVRVTWIPMVTVMARGGCEDHKREHDVIHPQYLRTVEDHKAENDAYRRFMESIPKYGTKPPCQPYNQHLWHETPPYGKICIKCGDIESGD